MTVLTMAVLAMIPLRKIQMMIPVMIILTKIAVIRIDVRFVTTAWIAVIVHVPNVVMMDIGAVSAAVYTAVNFVKNAAVA
jgi:hypothetical protein